MISGKANALLNFGHTFESSGVETREKAGLRASFAPTEPTIAPPPIIPTTKSTSNFLITFLALKAAVINLKAPLTADNLVAA